jgi:hypothetical protein
MTNVIAGTQVQFSAVGKDANNNTIPGLIFNWTTSVGTITGNGVFKAQTVAGVSGTIDARNGGRTGTMTTMVVPDQLTHIIVTPNVANVSAGKGMNVSAVGYDQFNNSISGLNFTWASNVGRISGVTFTAQDGAGVTGFVSARSGSVIGYNVVNIPSADNTWIIIPIVAIAIVAAAGYVLWRRKV